MTRQIRDLVVTVERLTELQRWKTNAFFFHSCFTLFVRVGTLGTNNGHISNYFCGSATLPPSKRINLQGF